MDSLPRGTAQIITAPVGPRLPLLHDTGADWPTYTGPIGLARLLVRSDRYLHEFYKYGRHNCFLSVDPDGDDCREFALSYHSQEQALRETLGVYFARKYDTEDELRRALRSVLDSELNQLEGTNQP